MGEPEPRTDRIGAAFRPVAGTHPLAPPATHGPSDQRPVAPDGFPSALDQPSFPGSRDDPDWLGHPPEPVRFDDDKDDHAPRARARIIGGSVLVGALLIGGGIGTYLLMTTDGSTPDGATEARDVAARYAERWQAQFRALTFEPEKIDPILCPAAQQNLRTSVRYLEDKRRSTPPNAEEITKIQGFTMTVRRVTINGETGVAEFDTAIPGGQSERQSIPLINTADGWRLCTTSPPAATTR